MADYIKRETAYDTLTEYYHHSTDTQHEALREALSRVPAADVREVVTCAKCRYYSEKQKKCGHVNGLSELVFPTDYCSYGSIMREVDDG